MVENPTNRLDIFSKFAIVVLLLVVFALRIYFLDSRPLWWDEGLTLTYAYLPPVANLDMARATEHLNPPLFNWLVGAQTSLVGVTVFGARLVSVFGGMLTAAAAYVLARIAFGRGVGLLTVLLLAVAPMQIYHAQEAKGYTVETAALFIAVYCWLRLHRWVLGRGFREGSAVTVASWPWWVGYAGATLLAMGTNYLAVFALITINVFTVAVTVQAARRGVAGRQLLAHWLRWLALQVVALLPLLPFVLGTVGSNTQGLENTAVDGDSYTPHGYLWTFLTQFVVSERPGGQAAMVLTVLMVLLAVAGLVVALPQQQRAGRRFAALWLFLPLTLGYLYHVALTWFFPRYLLYVQPALLLLAALGLVQLWRGPGKVTRSMGKLLAALLLTTILILSVPILRNHYHSPPDSPEDASWPLLFEAMQPFVQEGDGLVARTPWVPGYMRAYLPPAPQPDWILGYFDEDTIDESLLDFLDHHDRIWQIDYRMDPLSEANDATRSLRGDAAMAHSIVVDTAAATLFVADSMLQSNDTSDQRVSGFENGVHLRWAPQNAELSPGDVVGLNATWWTENSLDVWLVRYLHVISSDGTLVAQVDREPVIGASMSYEWAPWQMIPDPIALALPPDLPPGQYTLYVGLYDRDTSERVHLVEGGDSLVVGQIEIR